MKIYHWICAAVVSGAVAHSAASQPVTDAGIVGMIEHCIGFTLSDEDYEFPEDWFVNDYEERTYSSKPEIRIDREFLHLTVRAEIKADDRISSQTRAVIDRQCLVVPVNAPTAQRHRNGIDGYTAELEVARDRVEDVAADYAAGLVGMGAAVDQTQQYQDMYPNDPPEVTFKTCTRPSALVRINTREDGGVLGWDWSISVVRRDAPPDGCYSS